MSAPAIGRWVLLAAGVVVLATVVGAVATMGAPGTQREVRIDARRVSDLQEIEQSIEMHHREHGTLPSDLSVLAAQPGVALPLADPVTGLRYDYRIEGRRRYVLCARFVTDTARVSPDGRAWRHGQWAHGVGDRCFKRKVEAGSGPAG